MAPPKKADKKPAAKTTKTAAESSYSAVGNVLHYTITVENTGALSVHAVEVTDDSATIGTCTKNPVPGAPQLLAPTPPTSVTLAPGDVYVCSATHTVTQADLDAGSLTNTVFAKSGTSTTPYTTPTFALTIPAAQAPAMTVQKTSTTSNFPLGSGPSDRGDSDPAAGGSTSRAITAAWLCAISCARKATARRSCDIASRA